MEEELSTDAIGIPPRFEPGDVLKQDITSNTPDPSESEITLTTHETGCPQFNTQSQSKTLEKPIQSNNTKTIQNENIIDTSNDLPTYISERSPNISNASDFRDDRPTISNEYVVNAETTATKTKSPLPEEVQITHDKGKLNEASSDLKLPPEPPLEWRLNELLDDIAMEIEESEFKRIKLLFTGPDSLGEDLLNECDTCIKLFTVLKEKKYISRDNILYLNKILYILMRKDLIKRTVEYCNEEENVIHYYSFDGEPGRGKRYVKIHVVADVQNFNKEALDQLRYFVARMVCAPTEVVKIYAVEPGSSFLVTFIMPDIYVDVLKDLLQRKVNLWRLSSLQVDIVIVDDIHFEISGNSVEKMVTEQYKAIRNVYEQLNDKRKELEQLEITHLKRLEERNNLRDQLERSKKVSQGLTTTCSMLQKMHLTFSVTDTALDIFQSLMKEASDKGQNMELLHKIIKSNTEIIAAHHRSLHEIEREKQNLKIKERKLKENMLLQELLSNQKSAEEILNTKYSQHTLDIIITLNLNCTKSLYDLSKTLKYEEMEELINTVKWSKNDLVKACIEADKGLLLLGLECKQAEQTQKQVNTGTFLTKLGEKIGKNLLTMYNQIVEQHRKGGEEEKRKELNLQLFKQLTTKSKSTEEIVLSYAERFSFKCVIKSEEKSHTVPATFFVKQMIPKSKGLILFLNEDECSKVLSTYIWYEQDVIRECIKEDRRLLFPGLLCKEMEMSGKVILPDELIKRIQEHAKRADLLGLSNQVKADEKEQQLQIERWLERKTKEPQLPKMLSSGQSTAGEVLLLKLKKYTFKLADDIETKHFEKVAQLLGDLSEDLSKKEQSELIDIYEWEENDIIKACIAADEKLLLEGLWCKEMDITQIMPTIESFLSSICRTINREDIVERYRTNITIQMFDDKVLDHVLSKAADYCVPIMENIFENLKTVKDATKSPPFKTESTRTYYLQSFAGNNPYAELLPD